MVNSTVSWCQASVSHHHVSSGFRCWYRLPAGHDPGGSFSLNLLTLENGPQAFWPPKGSVVLHSECVHGGC